ncbi:MAG TPA: hypothetical protein VMZ25_06430 [Terriglobales bacterium]|nr:hypothetical protein [Terriglobales bacterium]
MLYTRGMVKINGSAARVSAPIKSGDSLQTSTDGTAQIVAEGTFIQVQPDSSVTYNRSSITVQDGVATIASAKELTGQVSSLRVSAITPSGVRYALRNQSGRVQVAALMGNVMVRGNNALAVELKPGEVYTLDTNSSSPDPQGGDNRTFFGDDAGLTFVISAAVISGVILGVMNAISVSPAGP